MEISVGINPNCSEATLTIKITDAEEKKVSDLCDKLNLELFGEEETIDSQKDWDDSGEPKREKEYNWSEATWRIRDIFGIKVLEIHGDAPYNHGSDVEKVVREYLPEAEMEWSEG